MTTFYVLRTTNIFFGGSLSQFRWATLDMGKDARYDYKCNEWMNLNVLLGLSEEEETRMEKDRRTGKKSMIRNGSKRSRGVWWRIVIKNHWNGNETWIVEKQSIILPNNTFKKGW